MNINVKEIQYQLDAIKEQGENHVKQIDVMIELNYQLIKVIQDNLPDYDITKLANLYLRSLNPHLTKEKIEGDE